MSKSVPIIITSGTHNVLVSIATHLDWMVWLRTPVGTRFFRPIQTGHEAHPAYCTMDMRSLSQRVKQLGCYTEYPPPSNAQLNLGTVIPLPPLCVCLACNKTSFTITYTVFRCILTKRYDCCSVITASLGWLNLLLTWKWRQIPLNYQSLISAASCKI